MKYLPPEFVRYDILLDNLLPGEAEIILYCLCVLLCEDGRIERGNTVTAPSGWATVHFRTWTGFKFWANKPPSLEPDQEAEIVAGLRPLLGEYMLL